MRKGKDPNADPWSEARTEKKGRVQKNLANRAKNVERGGGGPVPKAGIPVDLAPAAPATGALKRGKANTRAALELVQQSTGSMGK